MNTVSRQTFQLAAVGILALAATGAAAHATPVSYGLTLTATSGPNVGGTGILTLDEALPTMGYYSASDTDTNSTSSMTIKIDALSFTLSDGSKFSLAANGGPVTAQFANGALTNLGFGEYSTLPTFQIYGGSGTGMYQYVTSYNPYTQTSGTFTFSGTPIIATPEPASVVLAAPALLLGLMKLASGKRRPPGLERRTSI